MLYSRHPKNARRALRSIRGATLALEGSGILECEKRYIFCSFMIFSSFDVSCLCNEVGRYRWRISIPQSFI